MIDFASVNGAVRDAFGEPITFLPGAGGSYPATGVVQLPFKRQQMDGDGQVHWVWSEPSVSLPLADLPATPTKADRLVMRGKTYWAVEVHPDGMGWVNVILKATT